MSHRSHGRLVGKVDRAAVKLLEDKGAGIAALLPAQRVRQAMDDEGVHCRKCLFTPLLTLWMFLAQMLSRDGSCREAVAKLLASLASQYSAAADDVSPQTGPYCKARKRLPEGLISRLARESGRDLHARSPGELLLGGRPVKIVDGTTVSMPDTPANQKEWPQACTQKPGLGFPIARLVVVMSLSCAAVLDMAMGPYKGKQTGETALLRTLLGGLKAGDILLADRYYASYWLIAALVSQGADGLFRQHHLRKIDFRSGLRLGHDDHQIVITKPAQRPEWMDEATYQQMPPTLTVRELRLKVEQRGFRVRTLVLVTTLLDAQLYSKQELSNAFRLRWHIELDIRAIKQTMDMSVLRCKTPEMVRKEIWMKLLAYNLVRTTMAQAGQEAGLQPREISFTGALQTINAFAPMLQQARESDQPALIMVILRSMAAHRVGDRPDRYEPRAVKRRAKPIALLTVPREQARRRLVSAKAA